MVTRAACTCLQHLPSSVNIKCRHTARLELLIEVVELISRLSKCISMALCPCKDFANFLGCCSLTVQNLCQLARL